MSEIAISLPFRFGVESGVPGGLNSTSDPRYIWRDRVYIAVLTGVNERLMRPEYGTLLARSVLDSGDSAAQVARETIAGAFYRWLPKLSLSSVDTDFDTTEGILNITINYILPDGTPDEFSFKTAAFDRYGEKIEVIR